MKKLIFLITILFCTLTFAEGPIGPIGNPIGIPETYGPTWDNNPTVPQKNDIYDIMSAISTGTGTISFVMDAPLTSDDFLILRAPVDITITHIYGVLQSGTNVVGGLDECDANGANAVAVDADITFDGGLDQDDGTLANPTIDAGDWIRWHTTSVTAPGFLTITITFTVD